MAKKAPKTELPLGDEPGVGRKVIKELEDKAKKYKNFRDRRQELTKKEVEAKEELTDAVHKYEKQLGRDPEGVARYVYEDDSSPTGYSVVINEPAGEQTRVATYDDPGAPE